MNISASSFPSRTLVRCVVSSVSLFHCIAWAADPIGAAALSEPAKTHVLFMGADISVEQGRMLHPLTAATDQALIVEMDGKPLQIPHRRVTDIRIKDMLKLSSSSVTIEGLKAERAYSEGNDPFEALARSTTFAAGESAVADIAQGERVRADMSVAGAGAALASAGNPQDRAAAAASLADAQAKQSAAEQAVSRALAGSASSSHFERNLAAVGEEMFDAIRFGFEVRAERDLERPYYLLVATIREKDSRTKDARKWTYVKPLGPIAAGNSRKVRALQGGLPPGYVLESWEVHVYDGGEELATNLSRKRVEITEAEAQEFLIFEYIANNRGQTLPAALLEPTLAAAARDALGPDQARRTWHVRIDKSGRVTGVFLDAGGKQSVSNAGVEAVMKTLRFKPALNAGKPVESIIPLKLDAPL